MPPGDLDDSFQILSRHRVSRTPLDQYENWDTGAPRLGQEASVAGTVLRLGEGSSLTGGRAFHMGEGRWLSVLGWGIIL